MRDKPEVIALKTPLFDVNECYRDVTPLETITYSMAGRITSRLPIIYSASSACTLRNAISLAHPDIVVASQYESKRK
jgi:hypothetical protein